ncbi:MAG: YkgJ family cysteine cluster protein [Candidatus Methanoperedens sp.]|nr:YkgJ family cysteine cluster protein [Candidatus Methanoperedens sp.]MCZ7396634.1 YkgJ family cysteine cluster protein [Candidatus Methanoperedens sp.]
MDAASLGRRIERLTYTHSEVYSADILNSGFSCMRCGWCCRENFNIRITPKISRPSNAISIFPDDIRRIIKGTGMKWDEIAQPDIYSCLSDGEKIMAIGWILLRSDKNECIFYRKNECTIYEYRPMICRCYPFFMGEAGVEVMHCGGLGNKITPKHAEMALLLKRYEIKKLRSYISILAQLEEKLDLANLRQLTRDYSGDVLVCDGEKISLHQL